MKKQTKNQTTKVKKTVNKFMAWVKRQNLKTKPNHKAKHTGKQKVKKPVLFVGAFVLLILAVSLFFPQTMQNWFSLYPNVSAIENNALEVHFVNVGQGDAILVRLPSGETMMVDSGPANAKDNLLQYIKNVFFHNQTHKVFDYAVLTHSDADHSGNMVSVLNTYPVYNFFRPAIYAEGVETDLEPSFKVVDTQTYKNVITTLQGKAESGETQVWFYEGGLTISSGGVTYVTFYSPNVPTYSDTNNFSPIMVIEAYAQKLMLTGDADSSVELEVLNNYSAALLDVDVLKLAHHGASTSTSYNFLEVTTPDYAVISVSSDNSYGHPSEETLNNINQYSIANNSNLQNNVLATDEVGNIIFYVNENQQFAYLTIASVNNYLFTDWWVVCLVGMGLVVTVTIGTGVKTKRTKASNL